MEEKQLERITGTVKSDLNLSDDKLDTIKRYVKRAVNRSLVFCNRKDLPEPVEDVVAQIVEDMLRYDQIAPTENDVSSITRGDTSISYRDKKGAYEETVAFIKNYESQLIPFKRMKLPEDVRYDGS